MTQPAKGQEPSMEEILASIRRIIADDDPPTAAKRRPTRSRRVRPAPPALATAPVAAGSGRRGRQAEIDAMLAQLQEGPRPAPLPEQPVPMLERDRAMSRCPPLAADAFRGERARAAAARPPAPRMASRRAQRARPRLRGDHGGGRFRLQYARPDGAGAERPHARGSGPRDAAADAQDLARRQSAGHGRAAGARRDRARVARTRVIAERRIASSE